MAKIKIHLKSASFLSTVYGAILIIGLASVFWIHTLRFKDSQLSSQIMIFEVAGLALIFSAAPFLYAYFVKRKSFFRERELAGISHDLKIPLGGIRGALSMLENLEVGNVIERQDVDYLQMIWRNVTRMEKAIDNLLTVFKYTDMSKNLKIDSHDLAHLIRHTAAMFNEAVKEKELIMNLVIPPLGPQVKCDGVKIRQVMSNLLLNALNHTRTGGAITVSLLDSKREFRIEVNDTGEGIHADDLPRMFDRFFKSETSRNRRGSGLGLTIAKTWVEAHGGEIHAESEGIGKGTRFWFTLPR